MNRFSTNCSAMCSRLWIAAATFAAGLCTLPVASSQAAWLLHQPVQPHSKQTQLRQSEAKQAKSTQPKVELIATIEIPFDATDKSGMNEQIPGGVSHDRVGGIGSAIDHLGGNEYILLPDRGPIDGGSPYKTRVQRFRIEFNDGTPRWELTGTTLLFGADGANLVGAADRINAADPFNSSRFDPEGLRICSGNTMFVSEEYGPRIDAFNLNGKFVRSLDIPAAFRPKKYDANPDLELPPHSNRGRQPNRGFEGLAMTPAGRLVAISQSPLLQDGAIDAKDKRAGVNIRVLEMAPEAAGEKQHVSQWVYSLDEPSHGVSEILAVDDNLFLVIERDGKAGDKAGFKRIVIADTTLATDVSSIAQLPAGALPHALHAARKQTLIDLLDPAFGLAGESFPEKVEGLCFGPVDAQGRRTLLVATDNDFKDQPSKIWVFAIRQGVLEDPALRGEKNGGEPKVVQ